MKGVSMYLIYAVLAVALAGMAYVRLAPSDVARWHVFPAVTENQTMPDGAKRLLPGATLAELDVIALAEPRTRVLEGDVSKGMITYVSRSRVIGFPDYTTVRQTAQGLEIFARLRFGRSDLGVNAARLDRWIDTLTARQAGTQAAG
jgi:hypothetical protein